MSNIEGGTTTEWPAEPFPQRQCHVATDLMVKNCSIRTEGMRDSATDPDGECYCCRRALFLGPSSLFSASHLPALMFLSPRCLRHRLCLPRVRSSVHRRYSKVPQVAPKEKPKPAPKAGPGAVGPREAQERAVGDLRPKRAPTVAVHLCQLLSLPPCFGPCPQPRAYTHLSM